LATEAFVVNLPVRLASAVLTLFWVCVFGFEESNPLAEAIGLLPTVVLAVALGTALPVAFAFAGERLSGLGGFVFRFLSLSFTAFNVFNLYWDACFTALALFVQEPFRLGEVYRFRATVLSVVFGAGVAVLWEFLRESRGSA